MIAANKERRVLIADDEPSLALGMAQSMEPRLNCVVDVVEDGNAALEWLSRSTYQILITDMMMPGIHGLELIDSVIRQNPQTKIVVMTAYPQEFPFVEVTRRGADAFLIKPFLMSELEAILLRIFRDCDEAERVLAEKLGLEQNILRLEELRGQFSLNDRYRNLFEFGMNGEAVINPETWSLIDVNRAFCELTGFSREELLKRSFLELLTPRDAARFQNGITFFKQSGRGALADIRMLGKGDNEANLDVSIAHITLDDEPFLLATFHDMSVQREHQRNLVDAATKDPLTGLLNKRTFYSRVDSAIAAARRQAIPLSLMFFDLDNFKQCNDSKGHQAGDEVLKRTSHIIEKHIRSDRDAGFRFGGDEFAVLLVGAHSETAGKIGERMRAEFNAGDRNGTSLSIGIAEIDDEMDSERFVHAADSALYRAKTAGKDTICVA